MSGKCLDLGARDFASICGASVGEAGFLWTSIVMKVMLQIRGTTLWNLEEEYKEPSFPRQSRLD